MRCQWFGMAVLLLVGGCASVEMAQYSVTSFPEVVLEASEKAPAKVKFIASVDGVRPIVDALQRAFGSRKEFKVVDEGADFWFVVGGGQQYARGGAHRKFMKTEKNGGPGESGEEVISEQAVNLASAAQEMSIAVYQTKTLAPVYYFTIPLYTGDNGASAVKSGEDYAAAFSKDSIERFMDVFVQQQKDVETPIPLKADNELRRLFKERNYLGFLQRYKTLGCIDLAKYCDAARKVEAGEGDEADKALLKDADFRFANYYLYLLVREALVMDPEKLEKTMGEHLRILESCEADGIVESCPVALSRLEYKLSNLAK